MKNTVKTALVTLLVGSWFLSGCDGCGKALPTPKSNLVRSTITLQKLFAEAAKGPDANLEFINKTYSDLVKSQAQADELAAIKDTEGIIFCARW